MATDVPLTYQQSPRPVGFPILFKLTGDCLVVDSQRKVDEIRLGAVESVRLTYESRSFARRAYQTTLTLKDGKRVRLSSIHWKSMIEAESQTAAYGRFVRELIAAIARANPDVRLKAGRPRPAWIAIVALTALSLVAIAFFTWRALAAEAWIAALFGALIGAAGVWQLEPMVRLNTPRSFTPDSIPGDLLP
jgi:hypothetical protein